MKNVAYKTAEANPNFPNGFITEHFETDDEAVEGYTVVDKTVFSQLLIQNVNLMRSFETQNGITGAPSHIPPVPLVPNNMAQPADPAIMAAKKKELEDIKKAKDEEKELFKQFLAWKKSQESSE